MDYFLFLTRHTVNCRRQTEIKAKSTVQIPFFEKSAEMQLLNSNIPQRARTTRYSNKKAQDLLNLVLFVFCSFFVLQRWRSAGIFVHTRFVFRSRLFSLLCCPFYFFNTVGQSLFSYMLVCKVKSNDYFVFI